MAEHRVKKNNIIYVIPDDVLFEKWKNDEEYVKNKFMNYNVTALKGWLE